MYDQQAGSMLDDLSPSTRLLERLIRDLASSEARFRTITTHSAIGIVIVDGDGLVRYANPAAASLLGGEAPELEGRPFGFAIDPTDAVDIETMARDGSTRTVELRPASVQWEGRSAWLLTLHDVTERRRTTDALERTARQVIAQKAELEGILSHLTDGVMLADQDGRITRLNPAARSMLGLADQESWPGRAEAAYLRALEPDGSLLPPLRLPLARALRGERGLAHDLRVLVHGDERIISASYAPLRSEDGEIRGAVTVLRDFTDVQRAQQLASESDRLRALGEMASGVAHDFNNMLAVVLGRCEVLLAQARRNAPVEQLIAHAEVIRQTALDGADAVKRLQLFSGASRATEREPVDLADVISDVIQFTRFRWRDASLQRGVTITMEMEMAPLPPLMSSAPGLREVIANLVLHAVDNLSSGGVIRLSAGQEDGVVVIAIRAKGQGAAGASGTRVFAPFTTSGDTRRPALSAAQSMTVQLGGTMTVRAGEEGSLEVVLSFPFAPAPVQPTPLHAPRRHMILLVDDEPAVLSTTAALLRTQGHAVTTTPLAIDALARLQAAATTEPFDLLITDLSMPDMNGLQLITATRAAGLTLPCIIVTGWDMDLDLDTRTRAGVDAVLTKPFTLDELRAVIALATGETVG